MDFQIELLMQAVAELEDTAVPKSRRSKGSKGRIPWTKVAARVRALGASYPFGIGACKTKWLEQQ